ncbi:hypothetical protein Z051_08310 [Rhodococcus rhodochrous KG-21]|uniref:Leucine-binding protein domain-containing protein n=1 Tax=Rhodococcus rhodochrous KG-21 TaxID=1441923 RepID=A0A0M8PKC8_RHORH|nr:hypothetical protein Z051_08310 [Rhodococcus rhodochrous KG-21]
MLPVALAAAASVNAGGGINGRPIEVVGCNEENTPGGGQKCAQLAVDEGVAAVLGGFSNNGEAYYPPLEAAGIPAIGVSGQNGRDAVSPMSYPVNGMIASQMVGSGAAAAQHGCTDLAIITIDIPSSRQASNLVISGFVAAGQTRTKLVPVPLGAADYSPIVSAATSDSDCIVLVTGAQQAREFLAAFDQVGATQRIVGFGSINQSVVDSTGGADGPTDGALIVSSFPALTNPAWGSYLAAIDTYIDDREEIEAKGGDFKSSVETSTWVAYQVFAEIARGLDTIEPRTLVDALNSTPGVSTGGLTPDLQWNQPFDNPAMPRMFSRSVRYLTVEGGQFVGLDDEWHDMSAAFRGQKLAG